MPTTEKPDKVEVQQKFHNWVVETVLVSIASTDDVLVEFDHDNQEDCALMVLFMSFMCKQGDYFGTEVIQLMMGLKRAIVYLYQQNVISHQDFTITDHEQFRDVLSLIQKEKLYKLLFAYWDRQETKGDFTIDKQFIDGLCLNT